MLGVPKIPPFREVGFGGLKGFVVLYCSFRSLAFFGFIGFPSKAAKKLVYSYLPKCSQEG